MQPEARKPALPRPRRTYEASYITRHQNGPKELPFPHRIPQGPADYADPNRLVQPIALSRRSEVAKAGPRFLQTPLCQSDNPMKRASRVAHRTLPHRKPSRPPGPPRGVGSRWAWLMLTHEPRRHMAAGTTSDQNHAPHQAAIRDGPAGAERPALLGPEAEPRPICPRNARPKRPFPLAPAQRAH